MAAFQGAAGMEKQNFAHGTQGKILANNILPFGIPRNVPHHVPHFYVCKCGILYEILQYSGNWKQKEKRLRPHKTAVFGASKIAEPEGIRTPDTQLRKLESERLFMRVFSDCATPCATLP